MTLEKEIPDYALVPAKELKEKTTTSITRDAIFTPVEITNVSKGPDITFVVEEDILVPDTKPDLKEILVINSTCNLKLRQINIDKENNEPVNISGELSLETVYLPEKCDTICPIVPIESKIPFKETFLPGNSDEIILDSAIENIEYSVINERKYRVKVTVFLSVKEYSNVTLCIFEGLKNEGLQALREKISFSVLSVRKSDILNLKEYISPINDTSLGQLLSKDIKVIENYRQITADKVIINGFICLNILYCEKSSINDITPCSSIHQLQEKVEFTQFVPLKKGNEIGDCCITFDPSQLKLKISQYEDGQDMLLLEGDLITYIEAFQKTEKEIITDAYHNHKTFICDFKNQEISSLVCTPPSESSVREIFVPENMDCDIDGIFYTGGRVDEVKTFYEQNKIISEGTITAKLICCLENDNSDIIVIIQKIPFRTATHTQGLNGNETILQRIQLKDVWSEKINGKQLEFNAGLYIQTEIYDTKHISLLSDPAFEILPHSNRCAPMVIYCCKDGDTLWHIAKHFKTSKESIMEVNSIDKESLLPGQKILIIK